MKLSGCHRPMRASCLRCPRTDLPWWMRLHAGGRSFYLPHELQQWLISKENVNYFYVLLISTFTFSLEDIILIFKKILKWNIFTFAPCFLLRAKPSTFALTLSPLFSSHPFLLFIFSLSLSLCLQTLLVLSHFENKETNRRSPILYYSTIYFVFTHVIYYISKNMESIFCSRFIFTYSFFTPLENMPSIVYTLRFPLLFKVTSA